ncbi:uridine diphosphate-N-acetylglucosamine-binding protein YvcK [Vibrio palustris]|uniref:Putative gluconeogenesis factor n=1 Tax=Vibrio palustris TaxID=1918946 RepID=A0A1R4B1G5_9VIBR|nr:uridine diphosphate-N-acetylglucosamine-binding protein YvcK [Vibrio palustris]SJL82759.1 Gluconeogenesis factor [Vibrio palustris]
MSLHNTHKVVAIGGGHGLGRVLAALKDFGNHATGIVTTTDNGGSTGRIRHCQGGIAWGDMRNCLNQLITEPCISSMMFEYRFKGAGELNGHNLGNLILTALDNLSVRPLDAINLIRNMLGVEVNLLPMAEHPSDLAGLSTTGKWVTGETNIDDMQEPLLRLDLDPEVPATREAIHAINHANTIILGPGSFLTSVMPPLLLPELANAIAANTRATVIFIENLSPEFGPAKLMTLQQKLEWCERSFHARPIDVVIGEHAHPELEDRWNCVTRDLASLNRRWRHDRSKLQQAIEEHMQP